MTAPNLNDPESISALLEQLKASSAWQQLTTTSTHTSESDSDITPSNNSTRQSSNSIQVDREDESHTVDSSDNHSGTSPSVADLLSRLNSVPVPAFSVQKSRPQQRPSVPPFPTQFLSSGFAQLSNSTPLNPPVRNPAASDVKNLSFVQSLPLISQLAEDPAFLSAVAQMKKDQDDLERKLSSEREAIYNKYHSKFKVAQTKANLIGTSVSQHEIDMMTDSFKKEIARFDADRVLPAWDGLVSRQQQELSLLNLPTMFITAEKDDRERQQQVIGVLENIIGQKPSS